MNPQRAAALETYRRLRSRARSAFVDLIAALNRRDTLDGELTRSRHPLPPARIEYLTAESIEQHRLCEYWERELDDYAMKLKRLARELQLDEFDPDDDERGDGARSAGLRRTGDVGPATRAPRGAAADAPQQQRLFA